MGGELMPDERQALEHAQPRFGVADEATLFANADCGQAESRGRDARRSTGVLGSNVAAVLRQSGCWVGLFPEKQKAAMLNLIQKQLIFR